VYPPSTARPSAAVLRRPLRVSSILSIVFRVNPAPTLTNGDSTL
jgi:hypothetical protein